MIQIQLTITETPKGLTLDGGVTQTRAHTEMEDSFSKAILTALHPTLTQHLSAELQIAINVIVRHGP
jgi:hypothetical protein